jgi:capsular polysaccharide transport system permease protein
LFISQIHRMTAHTNQLPRTLKERIKGINRLFLLTVVIPTTAAALYYGFIAADVYVSESKFVVRSAQGSQSQMSVVGALLGGSGFTRAQEDAYPVVDYIESRDALSQLNVDSFVTNAYSKHGDVISRFHSFGGFSFEQLWKYYSKHIVNIALDPTSSIATLQVRAYSAQDASEINAKLIDISEDLVNRLNDRAASDTIAFAQRQVETATKTAREASQELAAYRQTHTVFDPDKQSALALQQATTLQSQLFAAQSQLGQLQLTSPQNPQISALTKYIETVKKQISSVSSNVMGATNSLSGKETEYTRLQLNSQFADKQLAAAMTALDNAHAEAEKKQLYLEVLVQPNTPDIAIEPLRLRGILAVLAVGLVLWGTLSLLIASIKEHQD